MNNISTIPVMEQFYTVQGEGYWSGAAAYFIRTAGCDVGCSWCDVKESWDYDPSQDTSIDQLVLQVKSSGTDIVVITGGEPAMYNLDPITKALNDKGIRTHIETSGAHPMSGNWHWICFSPKKFKPAHESVYAMAHELKVIVVNKSDFKFAEEHAAKVNDNCHLFLQPEWSKRDKVMPMIVDYVKNNPKWKISLQTHKYLNIP